MATKMFKDTVKARLASDPAFKEALLTEGLNALVDGDLETGRAVLHDYVNAAVGDGGGGRGTGRAPPERNADVQTEGGPSASNLFAVIRQLGARSGVTLQVGTGLFWIVGFAPEPDLGAPETRRWFQGGSRQRCQTARSSAVEVRRPPKLTLRA